MGDDWCEMSPSTSIPPEGFAMATMIKLHLPPGHADLTKVQSLPGLADLPLDPTFGLVPISPRESLYVVRTDFVDDLDRRRALSPEIIEAYGDIRISTTGRKVSPT